MTIRSPRPGCNRRVFGRALRAVLVLGMSASLLATPGCTFFKGEEENPPAKLVDFKPTLRIRKAWDVGIGDGTEALRLALAPASDGTKIYAAAHDGRVSAFDAVRGRRAWRAKTRLQLSAGPATDGEIVVVGSSNGEIAALDAQTGKQRWRRTVAGEVLAPAAIARGLVLVRTVDGKLTAFDAADGTQRWFVQQVMPRLTVRGTGGPVVVGEIVVCGFDNGRLGAYQLADGSTVWEVLLDPPAGRNEVERLSDINAPIAAIGEDLYTVSYRGQLRSVALESGQALWSRELRSHQGLAVDLQNVYVTETGGAVAALSRQTGSDLWRHELLLNRDVTGPTTYGDTIVVGDFDGYVHFFDAATGKTRARVRADGGRITSAPLVVNDMLYVQTDGGELTAFRQARK